MTLAWAAVMKRMGRIVVAVILAALLLMACFYAYKNIRAADGDNGDDNKTPGSSDVRVNETTVSVYVGKFDPEPALGDLMVRLYAPGQGRGDWAMSSSVRSEQNWTVADVVPGVGLSYRDLNNDGRLSNGEFFTVQGDDPLSMGIWHLEVFCDNLDNGSVTFHFHVLPEGFGPSGQEAEVDFIDVGQGDAELITTSDGKHVLIDAGTYESRDALVSYLSNRSITVLDALILSHPDADHIGGAPSVLEAFEVKSIYHPGLVKDTASFRAFVSAAAAEGCPVLTSSKVSAGDYLDLSLTEDFRVLSINASSVSNDASIVLRMESGNVSFLFTGDISSTVEDSLLALFPSDLDVDVLKVAHHGSRYSSSDAFLDAATPVYAVIEVGDGNTYGHPHVEALERFDGHQAIVIRTDIEGTYECLVADGVIL